MNAYSKSLKKEDALAMIAFYLDGEEQCTRSFSHKTDHRTLRSEVSTAIAVFRFDCVEYERLAVDEDYARNRLFQAIPAHMYCNDPEETDKQYVWNVYLVDQQRDIRIEDFYGSILALIWHLRGLHMFGYTVGYEYYGRSK